VLKNWGKVLLLGQKFRRALEEGNNTNYWNWKNWIQLE